MVVEQDELQNECRSRETCSFGTPDAVVCKAARSASAVLAAVGRSVGIGARAGAGFAVSATAIQVSPYFDPTYTRTGWIGQPPILNRHEVVTIDGDVDTLGQATP